MFQSIVDFVKVAKEALVIFRWFFESNQQATSDLQWIVNIKCAIEITQNQGRVRHKSVALDNPLATAKLQSQTVTPYQKIFISYFRQDTAVARAFKVAQTALGNKAFLDVDNLRAALARAIDAASIFQLFWPEHSASSEYCRYEWDYAQKARCPENNCEGFIRPVYWHKPMPLPPLELSHFNFKFVPFESHDD